MSDRLFSLEQQIKRCKQNAQTGFSEAASYDNYELFNNRLLSLQNSLVANGEIEDQSIPDPHPGLFSQSTAYFAEQFDRDRTARLTNAFHYDRPGPDINLFIDNLFDPTVRSTLQDRIRMAISSRQIEAWLIDEAELQLMLACWLNAWKSADTPAQDVNLLNRTHPSDVKLMSFLHNYITKQNLCLFEPDIEVAMPISEPVKYRLKGYIKRSLTDIEEANVPRFLRLLASGAHFVVISDSTDVGSASTVESFHLEFAKNLEHSYATYHSHYASVYTVPVVGKKLPISPGNINTAMVYPNFIRGDITPYECPFIVSLLVGSTAYLGRNTFFQLEGWPQTGLTSARHGQDYKVHDATKWNISTYGASPYSEKRGTTVFLAPATWNANARRSPETIMARYVGASTPQSWLDKTLIV